jgi:hypothetical protein
MRDISVRIPRTATRRNAPSFATLLEKVDPGASSAFDFHGKILTPGQTIEEHDLWPTSNYPAIPVLLERCQVCFEGHGHNRNPMEHILWIYQVRKREWRQVAHASSHGMGDWIPALLPLALRLVKPAQIPAEPDLHTLARRIAAVVDFEMGTLEDNRQRLRLLELAHDYLCQRRSDVFSSRLLYQMPLRPYDYFEELALPAEPDSLGWPESGRINATHVEDAATRRRPPGRQAWLFDGDKSKLG